MIHRFGNFELDEQRRELRLQGRERLLQPRVFDLLVYLVRHRDRVVGKEELLEALWPGVIVTDGSLQRVVSLARAALRDGDSPGGIRTFFRQGYRFVAEVETPEPGRTPSSPLPSELSAARQAFEKGDWPGAAKAFQAADEHRSLRAPDLERWARALCFSGHPRAALAPLERASTAHAAAGDARGGARVALILTQLLFEGCEPAVAKGWFRRAARLLEAEDESPEHGHLEWVASRFALVEGNQDEAVRRAEEARRIGQRLGDGDLDALGLVLGGHGRLASGRVAEGIAMHDEAAAAVLAGTVTPWYGGFIYCSVIWACRNRGDWQRAGQWTDQFTRWCGSNGLDSFPGTCQLHRAEVLAVRGALAEAEQEVRSACEKLPVVAPYAHGDAQRVLGDLHLSRGEYDRAESAYRRAHELGWDPQPGYAVVLAARGETDSAVRCLKRSLEDPGWSNRERRGLLLAHLAIVASRAGDLDAARAALRELDEHPDLHSTPSLESWRLLAAGEEHHARGEARQAVSSARRAIQHWAEVGAPLSMAEVRLRLAAFLVEAGDRAAAEMELDAAQAVYAERKLSAQAARCRKLRRRLLG